MRRVIIIAVMLAYSVRAQDAGVWWGALAAGGQPAALPDVTDGLVAWWKFDEASYNGTVGEVLDSISTNNGVAVNGATTSEGKIGRAALFDGVNDRLNLGAGSDAKPTVAMTVSAWVKFYTIPSGARFLCDWHNGGSGYDRWIIWSDQPAGLTFYVGTKGGDKNVSVSSVLTTNVWTHIVGIKSDSSISLFVDGMKVGESAATAEMWGSDTGIPIYAGAQDGIGATHNGLIDDFRIYNRALSSNEVNTVYNRYK